MSIQLALTEYCKDNGLMTKRQRDLLKITHLGPNGTGNHMFNIVNGNAGFPREELWELEKYDVGTWSLNQLVYQGLRKPSVKEVCDLVTHALGYQLMQTDVANVNPTQGGWIVTISDESYRFKGNFKLKNKRGK